MGLQMDFDLESVSYVAGNVIRREIRPRPAGTVNNDGEPRAIA